MEVKLLTRIEAMAYLNIKSSTTFRDWEKKGLIKGLTASKKGVTTRKRYSMTDLNKVFR